jgi:hypothetical protein
MKTRSIWNMLECLHVMLGTKDLTTWQSDFIRNCYDTVQHNKDTTRLSSKQVEIIESIFDKNFA